MNIRDAQIRVRKALRRYCPGDKDPFEATLVDLLADLRHYCDRAGLDFAACDRAAYCHYCEEKGTKPQSIAQQAVQ
jgi:hypothetical protein